MPHRVFVRPRLRPRVTLLQRLGPPFPLHGSGFRVVSFEKSRNIERVAARTHDYVIANNDRSRCGEVLLLHICDLYMPSLFTSLQFETDQIIVGRFEIQPVPIHPESTIPNVNTALSAPEIMP